MLDSLLPFIKCRIKLCLGYFDFEVNMMEGRNSGGCCKFSTILSILALLAALGAYFCPRKEGAPSMDAALDEKIKRGVLDVIKQNPQLLMDAMGEGIAKKREDAVKQLGNSVLAQKDAIVKQSFLVGNRESKNLIICFFDPLCKHCIEFQKSVVKLVQAKKDVLFALLPVGVLGDDSVVLAKVIASVYEKSPEKLLSFIEAVTSNGESVDKDAIEKSLKVINLTSKDIESLSADALKKIAENGVLAEKLGIPVVPSIFLIQGSNVKMIQNTAVEPLSDAITSGPDSVDPTAPVDGIPPIDAGAEPVQEAKN
ncbi:MAG: thioredoxin domain-containing protein [Holosporales bacterium]|jgi:protein-disulfide isomerase|nr:thioredoxin domain-containing protein [Holosporales bacterium]